MSQDNEKTPSRRSSLTGERVAMAGFTLIGLLTSLTIIGLLTTLMVPHFSCEIQKSKMAAVIVDARYGADLIEAFEVEHGRFPTSLDEVYDRNDPPDTLIYCIDEEDGNSGHGNEECSFFDNGNPSGNNNHGGLPNVGYVLRTVESVAPCQDFSLAWTTCCGRDPVPVPPGEEGSVPGHPKNGGK